MKGKPKYKLDDKVKIYMKDPSGPNTGWHQGEIYIVDANGTWDYPNEVSYDVMIHDYIHPNTPDKKGDCLVKHLPEEDVIPYEEEIKLVYSVFL